MHFFEEFFFVLLAYVKKLRGTRLRLDPLVWTKLFFNWQTSKYPKDSRTKFLGHKSVILQDNTSAIQLERYGKRSSTKRTQHIDIRYFYVTSKIYDQTVTAITYCPTKEMVADYLSKPLQGSLFRTHRNSIMGINEDDESEFYNLYRKRMDG